MTITVVRKKAKHIKELLSEYDLIHSTLNAMKRFKSQDLTYNPDSRMSKNMKKRLTKIEETFDHLLK